MESKAIYFRVRTKQTPIVASDGNSVQKPDLQCYSAVLCVHTCSLQIIIYPFLSLFYSYCCPVTVLMRYTY